MASILSLQKNRQERNSWNCQIGPKTADVLLTSRHGYGQNCKETRPGPARREVREIQAALRNFILWDKGERVEGLFWLLLKYTCKAQNQNATKALSLKSATIDKRRQNL